jgi:hypothetical protein
LQNCIESASLADNLEMTLADKRAVYWTTGIILVPIVVGIALAVAWSSVGPHFHLSGDAGDWIFLAVAIVNAPGLFAIIMPLMFIYGVHGIPEWCPFLAPLINWIFYYYVVFRPLFRWRARRAAQQSVPTQ